MRNPNYIKDISMRAALKMIKNVNHFGIEYYTPKTFTRVLEEIISGVIEQMDYLGTLPNGYKAYNHMETIKQMTITKMEIYGN